MTKVNPREGKTWPAYILGGRLRTSTLVLLIAFIGIGWLYHNYEPPARIPQQVPASEVVPPGFIPDPAYTWAPRTAVQRQTIAPTPTTSTPVESSAETPEPTTSGAPSTTAAPSGSSSATASPVSPTTSASPGASTTSVPTSATTSAHSSTATLPPLTHPTAPPSTSTPAPPTP